MYLHPSIKKGFSTTHPLLNKEIQALKRWLDIRDEYPQSTSEWLFLSRKGNPLSRQQFYQIISASGDQAGLPLEIHPHMLRHSCGFALANMGIDTRLIQIISATATFAIPSGTRPVTPGAFMVSGIIPARSKESRFSSKVALRHGWRFVVGSPLTASPCPPSPARLLQICSV